MSNMFFDKIDPLAFFLAFAVGLLLCYICHPKPQMVVKFPSPQNAGKVKYRTEDDGCFKFEAEKVACPIDKGLIKPQPIADTQQN